MVTRITIRSNDQERIEDLAILRRNLENPDAMLKQIGALLQANAQSAFINERLGPDQWAEQYPDQPSPFLNVAGVVSDAIKGETIKDRRLTRKPPLFDTGHLFRSLDDEGAIDVETGEYAVVVGTVVEYAAVHQYGGTSVMDVTPGAKQSLRDFLATKRGAPYTLKLLGLAEGEQDQLETQANQRPFLGVAGVEEDIKEVVERGLGDGLGFAPA